MDTGSREENGLKQQPGASLLIKSEAKLQGSHRFDEAETS
jgi:hypothetical protein